MFKALKYFIFLLTITIFIHIYTDNVYAASSDADINELITFIETSVNVESVKTTIIPNNEVAENSNGKLQVITTDLGKLKDAAGGLQLVLREKININDEDYKILCKIVQAEAGCEDIVGKILVANVIFNRIDSKDFNYNSVKSVVFAPRQFQPVSTGSYYSAIPSEETLSAVEKALDGVDYSNGALFFMNRTYSDKGNVGWFDGSLKYLFKHGGHEFFK